MRRRVLIVAALLLVPALRAGAWGPHPEITHAAVSVLPEAERWKARLGAENLAALDDLSWMPDQMGQETRDYYVDDYLLIRGSAAYPSHIAPAVERTFAPHFRRSLQALRTETPANACRQISPLVHYVEDLGAPPHTAPKIPQHGPLENWVKATEIAIPDYKPQLLGRTDDEAFAGLLARAKGLREFSAARADKALPLARKGEGERPNVEPILLESANECARVVADLLYTLFTLGLEKGAAGAGLEGTVVAPALPGNNTKGARIVLLDNVLYEESARDGRGPGNFVACATDYTTVAGTATGAPAEAGWRGEFRFHNLPAGVYRVLAYRPAAGWGVSEPVALAEGKVAKVALALTPADPPGNIILNPTAGLAYLPNGLPDRWLRGSAPDRKVTTARLWLSAKVKVEPQAACRCGAVLKDPKARVRFWFISKDPADAAGKATLVDHVDLAAGEERPAEVKFTPGAAALALVTVEPDTPLAGLIERVWIVPEGGEAPAAK